MSSAKRSIVRVVFQQVVHGDLKKFEAKSNDSPSGGGARDLRYRPYKEFEAVFKRLFPTVRQEQRRRGGVRKSVTLFVGDLCWDDPRSKTERSQEAVFEPPTDSRVGEGRLTRVHTYPPFQKGARQLKLSSDRAVVMLIQTKDGKVWPKFAQESSLRSGQWDKKIADFILNTLDAKRPRNQKAQGYLDFENGKSFSA